jgi:hypothetical protein
MAQASKLGRMGFQSFEPAQSLPLENPHFFGVRCVKILRLRFQMVHLKIISGDEIRRILVGDPPMTFAQL